MKKRIFAAMAAILAICANEAVADEKPKELLASLKLADLSIEELMEYEVTTVSKEPEPLFKAAASIYVITRDDIMRSGVTSLPEALRLAPGLQVSRIDGSKWAIGIRGLAGRFSNKLLVLQDGRTLYNSTFSGVYWNVNEIMLEDIERIEVIRGAGATLWGSNAVNGVINIITKSAKDTTGALISASAGSFERASAAVRYGAKTGDSGAIRMYGKYFYRESIQPLSGQDYEGYSNDWRTGFRGDWSLSGKNSVTLQGDVYDSRSGSGLYSGSNILGKWVKKLSETSDVSLQLYYDHSESSKRINKNQNDYFEKNDKIDIEFQHSFSPFKRQKIVWGSGIRFTSDSLPANSSTYNPIFLPASKDQHLFSAFLQDSIDIINDRLTLIIGSRIEHQDIIGWDIQPTARISYTPNRFHTIWGAVSRSVRTPSRAETSISAVVDFIPPTTEVRIFGNNRVSPEIVVSYETGYRVAPINTLYFDSVFFYNDYSRLIGLSAGAPTQTLMPINSATTSNGHTKGVELSANWKPENFARFKMLYSYIDESFSSKESLAADSSITYTNTTPRNQWSMLGSFDLPQNLYLDLWVRYVDSIGKLNVDDYATFDARIAWRPIKNLEISLVGQNLVEANHQEYGTDIFGNSPAQVPRSVYGKVIWEF